MPAEVTLPSWDKQTMVGHLSAKLLEERVIAGLIASRPRNFGRAKISWIDGVGYALRI
jgi:ribosome biogenesis protein Tsr3